jgi:hypothetical protein
MGPDMHGSLHSVYLRVQYQVLYTRFVYARSSSWRMSGV